MTWAKDGQTSAIVLVGWPETVATVIATTSLVETIGRLVNFRAMIIIKKFVDRRHIKADGLRMKKTS